MAAIGSATWSPVAIGTGSIIDGFNKNWDLGGGVAPNRTALPANAGLWPNAILFALDEPTTIPAGESFATTLYHQAGPSAVGNIDLTIFLDADFNPYNGNEIEVDQQTLPRTGTSAVSFNTLNATVDAAAVPPGSYSVCARLNDGVRTRYLYAPQLLVVTPSLQPPITRLTRVQRRRLPLRRARLSRPASDHSSVKRLANLGSSSNAPVYRNGLGICGRGRRQLLPAFLSGGACSVIDTAPLRRSRKHRKR